MSRDPTGLDDCQKDTVVAAKPAESDMAGPDGGISDDGGCDLLPPPSPPDIDPCAGKSDDCVKDEAAKTRAAAADLLAYVASRFPACVAALRTAGANTAAVRRANSNWPLLQQVGSATNVNPSALAAIGIRESGFRNIFGDHGHGRGTFQIDDRAYPKVTNTQAFNQTFAANFAANKLNSDFSVLYSKFGNFTDAQLDQATFASYNFGTPNISGNPNTIDVATTGNNYGSNTLAILINCF